MPITPTSRHHARRAARAAAALAIAGAALARSPSARADDPAQGATARPAAPDVHPGASTMPAPGAAPQPWGAPPPGHGGWALPSKAELPELPAWANPRIIEYEEGDPIVPGYALKARPSKGLLIGGLVTAGSAYAISLVLGSVVITAEGDRAGDEFWPLLVPAVGPFITIGTSRSEGAGTFWLAVDGAFQVGGIVMAAVAFAHEDLYLERQIAGEGAPAQRRRAERRSALLDPAVSIGPGSAALRWRF